MDDSFELQERIAGGQRLRCGGLGDDAGYCLMEACKSGFHSVVELLLGSAEWDQSEKDKALTITLRTKRLDLVELLVSYGADPRSADFADVCATANVELMERFLTAGCPSDVHNAFARGLDDTKARPLLRFLRSHISAVPTLRKQASLALACAAEEKKTRWAAMLVWAGADPLLQVPSRIYDDWDFSERGGRSAAEIACGSGEPELVKVLRLKPSSEQAQWLLFYAAISASPDVLAVLLRILPKKAVNHGNPPSCKAVEYFIRHEPYSPFNRHLDSDRTAKSTKCLEMLLEAGARWQPNADDLDRIRRDFLKTSPRHAVRVLRLLLYVPGAVDRDVVLDFCDSPRVRRKVDDGDGHLAKEMRVMLQTQTQRATSADA